VALYSTIARSCPYTALPDAGETDEMAAFVLHIGLLATLAESRVESRYPKLRPLGHITPQLFQGNGLETYFEPALKNYRDFARQQQTEINTKRQNYLNRHGHCQVCSFAFTPLLQVHHVIPISEGGDNRLLVVLCPTCHKLIHRLIAIKSNRRRQELLEFDWWTHRDNVAEWWVSAKTNINVLVDLYLSHLKYKNYDVFFQEFVPRERRKFPFIIIGSLSSQQTLAGELFR